MNIYTLGSYTLIRNYWNCIDESDTKFMNKFKLKSDLI